MLQAGNIDILSVRPAGMLPAATGEFASQSQQVTDLLGTPDAALCFVGKIVEEAHDIRIRKARPH
jgi:hypothetical protein